MTTAEHRAKGRDLQRRKCCMTHWPHFHKAVPVPGTGSASKPFGFLQTQFSQLQFLKWVILGVQETTRRACFPEESRPRLSCLLSAPIWWAFDASFDPTPAASKSPSLDFTLSTNDRLWKVNFLRMQRPAPWWLLKRVQWPRWYWDISWAVGLYFGGTRLWNLAAKPHLGVQLSSKGSGCFNQAQSKRGLQLCRLWYESLSTQA